MPISITPPYQNIYRPLLGILLLATTACSTTGSLTHKNASGIEWGITRADLEKNAGGGGQLQFKTTYNQERYECVSYFLPRTHNGYYFVFKEDALVSINLDKKFQDTKFVYEGTTRKTIVTPWEEHEKAAEIITTPTLPMDDFLSRLAVNTKGRKRSTAGRGSLNLWPVAIAMVPLSPVFMVQNATSKKGTRKQTKEWLDQFSPDKIQLGMTESEVLRQFGEPTFESKSGNQKTLSFGPPETLHINLPDDVKLQKKSLDVFWTSIAFQQGKVAGIYADDLFNRRKIANTDNYLN